MFADAYDPLPLKPGNFPGYGFEPGPANDLPGDADGLVIGLEPFDVFWRDGQRLVGAHMAEVGERPGMPFDLNVDLMQRLAAVGADHVITARCNGRMVGYLASIVAPSMENAGLLVGTQTAFFVSPDFRGIGPRLQRASLASLRALGVREVLFRVGTRGSGPKLGALYRRMGAQPFGQMFSLMLEET